MEAHLYDGIKKFSSTLVKILTRKSLSQLQKNEPIALGYCKHLGITEYFDGIYGSTPTAFHKADVLQRAIAENNANKDQSVIVGDTKYDMIGGKTVGIKTSGCYLGIWDKRNPLGRKS